MMSYITNQNVEKFMHEGYFSLEDVDEEHSNFTCKLQNLDKGKKILKLKQLLLYSSGLSFSAREKVLNNLKSILFPVKNLDKISTREPTPVLTTEPIKIKKYKLKLRQEFTN